MTLMDIPACALPARLPAMAKQGDRYFVRLTAEEKRKLDFLTVGAGVDSTEAFAGRLLAEAIEKAWATFDPKKAIANAKPAPKKPSK